MKTTGKSLLRACAFFVLVAFVLLGLGNFFQPVWMKWNNFNTTKGFYEEPKNTIETVFLGSSVVSSGFSPMEMYEECGISTFNLGMAQQPLLCSYYWLEESYRCHPKTLKNVIIEASSLRSGAGESFYHRAFDNMRFSSVKLRAVYDYMDGDIGRTASFISPLVSYHTRWKTLEKADFEKASYDRDSGTRGYYLIETSYANKSYFKPDRIKSPILDESAKPKKLLKDSVEYFGKAADFCKEKGIKLILVKTAANNWDDSLHNACQELADKHGVEFLDFNYDPYYNLDGSYIHDFDTNDGKHLNYFGSLKFSKWFAKYLVENYGATDIRENPDYDFMKAQYGEYRTRVGQEANLISSTSLKEYLEIAAASDNTVFIGIKEDGVKGLTKADREFLSDMGLKSLSKLGENESYVGIISGGETVREAINDPESEDTSPVYVRGRLENGTSYKIKSGGKKYGNLIEMSVGGTEIEDLGRGINIVVYSNSLESVIGSAVFDTHVSSERDTYGFKHTYLLLDKEGLSQQYSPESVRGRIVRYKEKLDSLR